MRAPSTDAGTPSEAAPPLPRHVAALEHALRLLGGVGRAVVDAPAQRVDRAPVARAVERATLGTVDAYDARRDPVAAIRDAIQACDEAAQALGPVVAEDAAFDAPRAWLGKARGFLLVAEEHHARAPVVPAPAAPVFAHGTLPGTFRLDRPGLAPLLRTPAPIPPPPAPAVDDAALLRMTPAERLARVRAGAEARAQKRVERPRALPARAIRRAEAAAASPGFVPGPHAALTPRAFQQKKARELFEEIGMTGVLRTPQLGEHWRAAEVFDARLLAALDAFAAIGEPALASLESLVLDAPAPDPSRLFAVGMIAGAVEGRDALAVVDRCFRHVGTALPEAQRALAEALALAPHPDRDAMLRTWLDDPEPGARAVAIEVLARRGSASPEDLATALGDEADEVVAAALPAAARLRVPGLGLALDGLRARQTSAALRRARAFAYVVGGVPGGVERLLEELGGEYADDVLLPLALSADHSRAQRLVELAREKPTEARLLAVGFAGAPEGVVLLVDLLRKGLGAELALAASFALDRLTGAEIYEDVELPPEKVDVPEPADPPNLPEPTLSRQVAPRDAPSEGSPDTVLAPTLQHGAWADFLSSRPELTSGTRRVRRGKPFTPALALTELDRYLLVPAERRLVHLELVIRTGDALPFDPRDFIPWQARDLDAWAAPAERASAEPGTWSGARLR